ncbi:MAG TPA: hypothetical protein VE981_08295 [Planctomycetota bacterium]|nr:hypothetical protein [Planctomycetota bacterium]
MVQVRLKPLRLRALTGFLAIAYTAILGEAVISEVVGVTVGNDRSSSDDDSWPSLSDLYRTTSVTEAMPDARAGDREWRRVNDFWSGETQGFYPITGAVHPPEDPQKVRCLPIEYWDGVGEWKGNLWMLYRMSTTPPDPSPTPEELIQRAIDELSK